MCYRTRRLIKQKVDIGPCPKVHSDSILKQFKEALEQVPRDPRIGIYKQEHENHIYGFVDDCDRRIKMAQRKLEKTPEENRKTVDLVSLSLTKSKTVGSSDNTISEKDLRGT